MANVKGFIIQHRAKYLIGLFVLIIAIVVVYVTQPLMGAEFGPIDDPKFLQLESRGRFVFFELLFELPSQMIKVGNTDIYRPVFYLWDGLGVTLVGASASRLFILRSGSFLLALLLTLVVIRKVLLIVYPITLKTRNLLSTVAGSSAAIAFGAQNGWLDVIPRLGPAEALQVIGLSISALSALKILHDDRASRALFVILILGIFLCGGTKEPGLISMVFLFLVTRQVLTQMKQSQIDRIIVLVGLTLTLLLVLNVGLFLLRDGVDQYGNARNHITILSGILKRVGSQKGIALVMALLLIRLHGESSENPKQFVVFKTLLACWLAWVLEGGVYLIDAQPLRYRLLSQMLEVWIVVTALAVGIGQLISRDLRSFIFVRVAILLVTVNLLWFPVSSIGELRQANESTRNTSASYWNQVMNIAGDAEVSKSRILLFSFDAAANYEPISSLGTYLRFVGIRSPISVYNLEPSDEIWNSPEWLSIQSFMTEGSQDKFQPFSTNQSQPSTCVSFGFTLDNPESPYYELTSRLCDQFVRF